MNVGWNEFGVKWTWGEMNVGWNDTKPSKRWFYQPCFRQKHWRRWTRICLRSSPLHKNVGGDPGRQTCHPLCRCCCCPNQGTLGCQNPPDGCTLYLCTSCTLRRPLFVPLPNSPCKRSRFVQGRTWWQFGTGFWHCLFFANRTLNR